MTLWCPVMFNGEHEMLEGRLETFGDADVVHLVTEAPYTHRGVPKPMYFSEKAKVRHSFPGHRIWAALHYEDPDPHPWVNEHRQRNAAWTWIDGEASDTDVVLISDLDEWPSPELLAFAAGPIRDDAQVMSVPMRTFLFAADWEVKAPLPPTCVIATVAYLRKRAADGDLLAEVRDGRDRYLKFGGFGGWHFSWMGGPEAHKRKLLTSTCHTELLVSPEGGLIASGDRWRTAEDGGGLPVVPVDVDETWPAFIRERRCPPEWYRPREAAA